MHGNMQNWNLIAIFLKETFKHTNHTVYHVVLRPRPQQIKKFIIIEKNSNQTILGVWNPCSFGNNT